MKSGDPYLDQVYRALPRLLALYDVDPLSATHGLGDRYRWSWRLIDFANGTFQGAANGLARLLANALLPDDLSAAAVLRRIDAMFEGADRLRRPDGSLEEAFPYESSFCVTALVAFDLLTAVELLSPRLGDERRRRYLGIVRPMIGFLDRVDETHAVISNHLATAAAALFKWRALAGEGTEDRARAVLDSLLAVQSDEGWFAEYGGADPGYQSLCTYYLADLHRLRPDLGLLPPLRRSVQFLWHFAHPDGSFGGLYGSRNTRFYVPAGLEALRDEVVEAAALARFMRSAIRRRTTVTLETMDEPNLVPLFNAYCWAAALVGEEGEAPRDDELPAVSAGPWRRTFGEAGLLVDRGEAHYTVVSWHKGGVCYHFRNGQPTGRIDAGVAARAADGSLYSTQGYRPENAVELHGDRLIVTAPLTSVNRRLPSPLAVVALRLASLTILRSRAAKSWFKKRLVRRLVTGRREVPLENRRTLRLGPNLAIEDRWVGDAGGFERLEPSAPFSALQMASQGYWQLGDDAS